MTLVTPVSEHEHELDDTRFPGLARARTVDTTLVITALKRSGVLAADLRSTRGDQRVRRTRSWSSTADHLDGPDCTTGPGCRPGATSCDNPAQRV